MNITDVKAVYPKYEHVVPSWRTHFWQIVVRVKSDLGLTGFGYGGGGVASVEVVNRHLRELLIRRRLDSVEDIRDAWDALYDESLPYGRKGIGVKVCCMRQTNIERRSLKAVPIVAAITLCAVGAAVSCTVNHDNSTNGPIGPVQGNPADHVGTNQGTVLAALAELGIELAPTGTSRAELLYTAPSEAYRIGPATVKSDEWLYIHRYPSAKAASDYAARILDQNDHRLPDAIDWVNWPHFFRCDHLIVLYLGEQEKVLKELSALCGPQFAGN